MHSQLNPTRVARIVKPCDVNELRSAIERAASDGRAVSIAGGRHAMGGQQFGDDTVLIDSRDLNKVLDFDRAAGTVTVEGGIQWPQLLEFLNREQSDNGAQARVRLIEKDEETFLAWAKDRYACVIFNLHIEHSSSAVDRAADAFRGLIDLGIEHGGSYYLTYHRWATREQVEHCYPQMREFLRLKREHDPAERFQSTWYRHYRTLMA